jgi:hypothetical protein
MTDPQKPGVDPDTERRLDAQCLVVEMAGQTWYVPFGTLPAIPRVGEKIGRWQHWPSGRSRV